MTDYKAAAEEYAKPTWSPRSGCTYIREPTAIATGQVYAILALATALEHLATVLQPPTTADPERQTP